MKFGDTIEEFIFLVFKYQKIEKHIDYFQLADEPEEEHDESHNHSGELLESGGGSDRVSLNIPQKSPREPESSNASPTAPKYEMCTVIEESNEEEGEESKNNSTRKIKMERPGSKINWETPRGSMTSPPAFTELLGEVSMENITIDGQEDCETKSKHEIETPEDADYHKRRKTEGMKRESPSKEGSKDRLQKMVVPVPSSEDYAEAVKTSPQKESQPIAKSIMDPKTPEEFIQNVRIDSFEDKIKDVDNQEIQITDSYTNNAKIIEKLESKIFKLIKETKQQLEVKRVSKTPVRDRLKNIQNVFQVPKMTGPKTANARTASRDKDKIPGNSSFEVGHRRATAGPTHQSFEIVNTPERARTNSNKRKEQRMTNNLRASEGDGVKIQSNSMQVLGSSHTHRIPRRGVFRTDHLSPSTLYQPLYEKSAPTLPSGNICVSLKLDLSKLIPTQFMKSDSPACTTFTSALHSGNLPISLYKQSERSTNLFATTQGGFFNTSGLGMKTSGHRQTPSYNQETCDCKTEEADLTSRSTNKTAEQMVKDTFKKRYPTLPYLAFNQKGPVSVIASSVQVGESFIHICPHCNATRPQPTTSSVPTTAKVQSKLTSTHHRSNQQKPIFKKKVQTSNATTQENMNKTIGKYLSPKSISPDRVSDKNPQSARSKSRDSKKSRTTSADILNKCLHGDLNTRIKALTSHVRNRKFTADQTNARAPTTCAEKFLTGQSEEVANQSKPFASSNLVSDSKQLYPKEATLHSRNLFPVPHLTQQEPLPQKTHQTTDQNTAAVGVGLLNQFYNQHRSSTGSVPIEPKKAYMQLGSIVTSKFHPTLDSRRTPVEPKQNKQADKSKDNAKKLQQKSFEIDPRSLNGIKEKLRSSLLGA